MYNPEPAHVVSGRRFLYDAAFSSSHGDSACASCHIFGDMDHLGWDLGNPDQPNVPDPNVYVNTPSTRVFASMKGVMTTQSLRGMDNQGPMHWRSDRTGAAVEPSAPPNAGHFNERLAFKAFNVAFPGLLGRDSPIPDANMEAFTRFILKVMYPPNPDPNEPLTSFPPFLGIQINNPEGLSMLPAGFPIHEALDAYMMVFDSNFAPIVGQQVTLTDDNEAEARPRITLLRARALQDECQLIARDADNEGYLFGGSVYVRNQANKPPLTEAQLRTKAHPHGAVRARLSLPDSDVPRCAREGTPCSRPQDCTIEECDALEH
jgi:hypothetical protein